MPTKPPPGVMDDPSHPLSKGCVCHLLFNEGAGRLAYDVSGHGNLGALKNMSPNAQDSGWGGSNFGGGLHFDGADDYVDCGNKGIVSKSITCWAKFTDSGSAQGIVSNNTDNYHLLSTGTNGNRFATIPDSGAGVGVKTVNTYNDDQWHFVVVLRDSNEIYVDGVKVATESDTNNYNIEAKTLIGRRWVLRNFNGSIDDARIYNRALNAEERKQLYHDPFCNSLQVPAWQLYSPAVGGLSIPVAMHQYEMLRA